MRESAMRPGWWWPGREGVTGGGENAQGWLANRMRAGTRPGPRQTLEPFSACQMMFPVFLGQRVPPETLANTLAELDRCLQLLEDKFLKDQDFLGRAPHLSGGLGGWPSPS